ncbi:hypothetical protein ACFIOY_19225 [Bradyrhizobium sp. TZ2]
MTDKFSDLNDGIGFDSTGEMNKLWMDPSSSVGMPTSFVVDRDGHIAFIGPSMQLDDVLPKVLNGTWRTSDGAAGTERIAESECTTREMTRKRVFTESILAKLTPAMNAEDWAKALSAVEEAIDVMSDYVNFPVLHADLSLHKLRDLQTGLLVISQLFRDAIDKKSELWMAGTMRQLFGPANDNSQFPPASRFPMGKELQLRKMGPKASKRRRRSRHEKVGWSELLLGILTFSGGPVATKTDGLTVPHENAKRLLRHQNEPLRTAIEAGGSRRPSPRFCRRAKMNDVDPACLAQTKLSKGSHTAGRCLRSKLSCCRTRKA